jgi:mono/diheme cytochrome c family protein/uncharacterized coiled-coil protein SlyX
MTSASPTWRLLFSGMLLAIITPCGGTVRAEGMAPAAEVAGHEFFEKEVRPLLVERCLECHGGRGKKGVQTRGGLDLTSRAKLLEGGNNGAVVADKVADSLLLRAVHYRGKTRMPPAGKLTDRQIQVLTRWVELGLPWPDSIRLGTGTMELTEWQRWAFQAPKAPPLPEVKHADWVKNPIDRFILATLEAKGMTPARPADKRTLIRRATFDLTGLPPTAEEVEAFLKDDAADAFPKLVERLLASPAYGERWGRHWLDTVRYTDYHAPDPKAHASSSKFELFEAWRYRDWVVDAFNRDLPYDQFIVHQLAGDRLPSPAGEAVYADGLIATSFLAIGTWDNGDADKHKIVSDIVDDQIDVVGRAFLGLTLACARCHDHKFDPITQKDYYALAGIFYSTRILAGLGTKGDHTVALRVPLAPPEVVAQRRQYEQRVAELEKQLKDQKAKLAELEKQLKEKKEPDDNLADQIQQKKDKLAELSATLAELQKNAPAPLPLALAAQDGGVPGSKFPGIQDVPIHQRGSYTRLEATPVKRQMPEFFAGKEQPPIASGSGRLELARWIASKDHPLTARVLVNRIWQHHFGEGLVRTPSNFGKLGVPPTHPELLDWLAQRFVEDGWSVKQLHRRIMLSAVYQQASVVSPDQVRADPDNLLLGRMSVRRLEAEAIRDAMLLATGRLDRTRGGPATADLLLPRRSLYIQTVRQDRSNFSTLFDAANPEQPVEKRAVSTVAPQALFLLNSAFVQAQSKHLAQRLHELGAGDDAARIDQLYRWLYGRSAKAKEIEIGRGFLKSGDAWTDYVHLLLCSNEFVYID